MTRTEEVMQAFHALLAEASADGRLPDVGRDESTFTRTATWSTSDGLTGEVGIALFDGNGSPDAERLSPQDYEMIHEAEVEILVFGEQRTALFDRLLETVGEIVTANQVTDAWDAAECRAPQRDYPAADSHDLGKSCILPVAFTFTSIQPF